MEGAADHQNHGGETRITGKLRNPRLWRQEIGIRNHEVIDPATAHQIPDQSDAGDGSSKVEETDTHAEYRAGNGAARCQRHETHGPEAGGQKTRARNHGAECDQDRHHQRKGQPPTKQKYDHDREKEHLVDNDIQMPADPGDTSKTEDGRDHTHGESKPCQFIE